jgi:GT2 family glycosyltransferase
MDRLRQWAAVSAELSIIIVNWNGGGLLGRCVESILFHPPGVPYEIVVADNGSSDGSVDALRGRVRLIENGANLGFGRANNIAIDQTEAPFVFLLNPDTEVLPGAINALLATLKSDARIGAVAPRLLNTDLTLQPSVWGDIPYPLYVLLNDLPLHRLLPQPLRGRLLRGRHWDHRERMRVSSFSGAAIMAKRKMIDEVGVFDERFHMYGEDAEWCMRIYRSGWWLIFEPAAEVVHHGGQSAAKRWNDHDRRMKEEEANLRFQFQCTPPAQFMINTLTSAAVLRLQRAQARRRGEPVELLDSVIALKMAFIKRTLRSLAGGKISH